MPVNIPGFYFDAARNRYFKIEGSQTAPPAQASYSSDSVKRRRVDDRAREALRREESRLARGGNVRRAAAVWGDDLARGLLERELGLGSRVAGDVGAAGWAAGAGSLGRLGMAGVEGGGDAMGCFWVGTPRGMDVGVAVVPMANRCTVRYVLADSYGSIECRLDSPFNPRGGSSLFSVGNCEGRRPTSISYSPLRNSLLMTSAESGMDSVLDSIEPETHPGSRRWIFNIDSRLQNHKEESLLRRRRDLFREANLCVAQQHAPGPANVHALLGTSDGVFALSEDNSVRRLAGPPGGGPRSEIFALDFRPSDPNCFVAGGRDISSHALSGAAGNRRHQQHQHQHQQQFKGRKPDPTSLARVHDLRLPGGGPASSFRLPSTANHLRWVGEHHLVASHLRSGLALHDVRFPKRDPGNSDSSSSSGGGGGGGGTRQWPSEELSRPVLVFPEHRNEAHVRAGLDVSPALGLCAAAQDDGTVKVFSLRTGRWLRSGRGAVHRPRAHNHHSPSLPEQQLYGRRTIPETTTATARGGIEDIRRDRPVQALRFARMPRERCESLFVAEGWDLAKYGFGSTSLADEDGDDSGEEG